MAQHNLSSTSTIADVVPTLGDAEDYLCGVLGKMHACRKTHGNAVVRIGITGKGIYPAYRIEHEMKGTDMDSGEEVSCPTAILFDAYGGRNHAPFTDVEIGEQTWSSAFLSEDQVKSILGELRSLKKFGKKS